MHLLYAKRVDSALSYNDLKKRYWKGVDQTYDSYLFTLWLLVKTCEISKKDESKRKSKYLPSEEDMQFSAKLYTNDCVQSIVKNVDFQKLLKSRTIPARIDSDLSAVFYNDFAKSDEYKKYVSGEDENANHIQALLDLYKMCTGKESYEDYIEEKFDNYIHDRSLVLGAIKKTIKGLPAELDFHKEYYPGKETTEEFGEDLLYKCNHFEEDLMGIISPALKNWDANRVAIVDLILLKMALCEMLHFPTIPVKVTINEFVDISKLYSTPKSKDFINGILDRLMKKLSKDGKISKDGRGLLD